MSSASAAVAPRVVGVDTARALASLIMVQGHAYHAWVAEPFRDSPSYLFTRLLGSLPLPAFLLLAGAGMGLRARAAVRRNEAAKAVRRGLLGRGAQVLLAGYTTNLAFAWLDGGRGLDTLLRADVLHVIGLSIVSLAALGFGADATGALDLRFLRRAALGLALLATLLCPWLSPLGSLAPAWLAPLLAPFVDVPGLTRMPLLPLVAWLAIGALLGTSERVLPGDGPTRGLVLLGCAAAVAWGASWATDWTVRSLGGSLSRAHPAVVFNVLDLAARGTLVLAVGLLLGDALPARGARFAARLGQSSLWIYVAHLPFCYGRAGRPLFHALDMGQATLWLLPLMAGSVAVGLARARVREARTRRRAHPSTSTCTSTTVSGRARHSQALENWRSRG